MSSKRFLGLGLLVLALIVLLPLTVMAGTMPRVLVLGTGGTIVGMANGNSDTGYTAGQLPVSEILNSLPGFKKLNISVASEQIANISSQDMNFAVWKKLAQRIQQAEDNEEADAFVITHGTDTMEETAFFLDQILCTDHPVVLVGSMRPASAVSADGPRNLIDAIKTAVDVDSFGRGVLVCFGGQIYGARHVLKSSTLDVQAMKASLGGPIGFVDAHKAYYFTTSQIRKAPRFKLDLSGVDKLPRVDIVPMYAGAGPEAIDACVAGGAAGIIIEGVGDGNMPKSCLDACGRASKAGVVVVRSSRVYGCCVHRDHEFKDSDYGTYASYDLTPQKARITLQLLLQSGVKDPEAVQKAFDGYAPGALRYSE